MTRGWMKLAAGMLAVTLTSGIGCAQAPENCCSCSDDPSGNCPDPCKQPGPLAHAFITRNPLLPEDYFTPKNGVDELVLKINKNVPHSLLDLTREESGAWPASRQSIRDQLDPMPHRRPGTALQMRDGVGPDHLGRALDVHPAQPRRVREERIGA